MQISGPANSHDSSDHHITNCLHDHSQIQKKSGGAAAKSAASTELSGIRQELQQEPQFSLSSWLKNALGTGRGLLRNFWGGNQTDITDTAGKRENPSQVMAQAGDPNTAAAASMAVQPQMRSQTIHNNPYFSALEDTGNQKQTLWQKMKVRFHNVSGQLSGRLPKKFFGFQAKNSFQARQERPKEDLRKHSRYREDTVEIDCVLTDDSYLMDSYDRKGEYSTLTTKK